MATEGVERTLDQRECWKHLREHPAKIGRLAFVSDGLPTILPINYRVDGESVVFRTRPGAKLAAVSDGNLLAFQSDDVDVSWQSGWSVLLRGKGEHVVQPGEIRRLEDLGLQPWAPGERDQWVRIRPSRIEGRQLV